MAGREGLAAKIARKVGAIRAKVARKFRSVEFAGRDKAKPAKAKTKAKV